MTKRIVELADFGWAGVWIDASKISVVGRIRTIKGRHPDTKAEITTHFFSACIGGDTSRFELDDPSADDLGRLTGLHDYLVQQMKQHAGEA